MSEISEFNMNKIEIKVVNNNDDDDIIEWVDLDLGGFWIWVVEVMDSVAPMRNIPAPPVR